MADTDAIARFALALADDALVLGHRLSQWSSRAPSLEEDIALSNLGLDLIGQARLFYTLAGEAEGKGRGEDDFAYFRGPEDFTNVRLVELPNGDFAHTMVRHLIYSAFVHPYFEVLAQSPHKGLSEIAAKAVKEMAYHVRHAAEWVIRLGDGTEGSRRRTIAALEALVGYEAELFEMTAHETSLLARDLVPDRAMLRPAFERTISHVLAEARLEPPKAHERMTGGRSGTHTEHLAPMLEEMQSLARAHPGVTW